MNIWYLKFDVNKYGFRYLDVDEEYGRMIRRCNRIEKKQEIIYTLDHEWKGSDYADIYSFADIKGTFAINKQTKEILEKNVTINVEYLPITSNESDEEIYIVHILSAADVLDLKNCKCRYICNNYIYEIKKYSFKPEVKEYSIFKCIKQGVIDTVNIYCTDTFKDIIDENNITGFLFEKIYEI